LNNYNVIVIGGGASGLLCAIELLNGTNALLGKDVLILEGNDRVAKKLVATGNGQGNLTNAVLSQENYFGDSNFIRTFLAQEKEIDLKSYLYSLGIPLCEGAEGKMYPISKQANAVCDILRFTLSQKCCNILTGKKVTEVKKSSSGFTVCCGDEKFIASNVVIATGGSAGGHFGTDGSSYALCEKLGHTKTKLYPSLVQIKTELPLIRGLKGLKEVARVTAFDGDKKLKSAVGDLLFTEYGISGNAVFKVSGLLAQAKNPSVKIEFLPSLDEIQLETILLNRENNQCFYGDNAYLGLLSKRVGQAVYKTIDKQKITAKDLCFAVKNFRLKVTGTLGFNNAQVTKGGIRTNEINEKTYESKIVNSLYLTGELLDIDGDCGGYNLTFAFVSGIVSAKSIKSKIKG